MNLFVSFALISKVLFEITLRREWKNYLAAQILQRTLFLYCYKEHFLFYSVRPFFGAESGAKVNHFFEPPKLFVSFFSKNFQNLFAYPFETYLFRKADAKVNRFSESPKLFEKFFQNFFRTFSCIPSSAPSGKAGAKVTRFSMKAKHSVIFFSKKRIYDLFSYFWLRYSLKARTKSCSALYII